MIRELEISELGTVIDLAKEWFSSSNILGIFRLERFKEVWTQILGSRIGVIYGYFDVDKIKGVIGGFHHADMNSGERIAMECFWYMAKDSRGGGLHLLDAFERWANENKCKKIRMTQLLEGPDGVAKVYERRNYYPIEVIFTREI